MRPIIIKKRKQAKYGFVGVGEGGIQTKAMKSEAGGAGGFQRVLKLGKAGVVNAVITVCRVGDGFIFIIVFVIGFKDLLVIGWGELHG